MSANLIIALQQVPDHRSRQGRRYPLWFVLLLVVMATLTGSDSYKSLEDFGKRHHCALKELLRLDISGFPSDTTIRRLLQKLDWKQLTRTFNCWASAYLHLSPETELAMDGKSIKSTLTNYNNAHQNFVNIVSIYSQEQGCVFAQQAFLNKEGSEIEVVRSLLEALHLEDMVITIDSLHCQKKL